VILWGWDDLATSWMSLLRLERCSDQHSRNEQFVLRSTFSSHASHPHRSLVLANTSNTQVSAGLLPDGRHLTSRARDEASEWRSFYKTAIPVSSLADRMGAYVQAHTLYNSVRPFGVTAILGGWDSELDAVVDGEVGSGPKAGPGGRQPGRVREGGPGLYMVEPSGLFWVGCCWCWCCVLTHFTHSQEKKTTKS